jgi:hypothetical protein
VANNLVGQDSEPPVDFPAVPTPDIGAGTGPIRLIVGELKDDIRDIKSHRHSDFVYIITVLGGAFLLLSGMLIFGYFRMDDRINKLDDKINAVTIAITRIDTKLGDLLERIPPPQMPVPTKR